MCYQQSALGLQKPACFHIKSLPPSDVLFPDAAAVETNLNLEVYVKKIIKHQPSVNAQPCQTWISQPSSEICLGFNRTFSTNRLYRDITVG